jgi:hypothetical protein
MNPSFSRRAGAALPVAVLVVLFFQGCGRKSEMPRIESTASESGTRSGKEASSPESWSRSAYASDTKLIYNAEMDLSVKSFTEAEARLKSETEKLGGYISETKSYTGDNGNKSGSIKLRVPSKSFRAALEAFARAGEVRSRREWTQDVTAEYIDVQSRLNNYRTLEARLLKLVEMEGAKLDGLVAVETKLADVRTQIETQEGRLRYLKNQIDFSTITLTVYEPSTERGAQDSVLYPLVWALHQVGIVFFGSIGVLVLIIVGGAPWVILVVVLVRVRRRRRRTLVPPEAAKG